MQTETVSKKAALRRIFGFTKGFRLRYLVCLYMYSSQGFNSSLMFSLLMGGLTANIMAGSLQAVLKTGMISIAVMVSYFLLLAIAVYHYIIGSLKIQKRLKKSLFHSFVTAGMESGQHSSQGIAAINTEADMAINLATNSLSGLLSCLSAIVLSGLSIFVMDYRLGLVSLAMGLIGLAVQSRFAPALERIAHTRLDANARSVRHVSGLITGAVAIRAFGLQEKALQAFDEENRAMLKLSYKEATILTLQNMMTNLQSWLSLAGVLGVGGYLVATGRLDFATLMMVPSLCFSVGYGMSYLGAAWAGVQAPLAAARRVCMLIDKSTAIHAVDEKRVSVAWDGNSALRISDLHFAYADAKEETLRGVSVDIQPLTTIAFVGESGSGKSTLLRLLTGLYERGVLPVHMGNLQLGVVPAAQWRSQFAMVDQSCKLFDMSIRENIALGRPGATHQEIEQAAREAGAYTFIKALPQGFDTPCGERGAALSGGQKQRIAIARALVRKAPVLVLDEATAALDAQSEQALMKTIETLREKYTVLMVTHNLHQTLHADTVVVLKDGNIVEQGNAGDLLEQGGEYARLWNKEAKAS